MICWFTKLRIKSIALRDAKGLYGKYLIQCQKVLNKDPSINIDFQPSDWLKSLVSDYTNTVEKLFNERKKIVVLYTQIRQCFARLNEANDELNNKKSEISSAMSDIDMEIDRIEEEIAEVSRLLSEFYDGKPLPNGLTARKLTNSKAEFEQKRFQKQTQKNTISDLSTYQIEHDRLAKELKDKVIELESDFTKQIDVLFKRVRKIEIKYNEQISYYWKKLYTYIQHSKLYTNNNQIIQNEGPEKQLRDIALSCGISLPTKEDLFKGERAFINTTINQIMNIHYEV